MNSTSPTFKVCSLCEKLLEVALFNKRRASSDGLQSRCRACESQRKRERRRMTPEQRAATDLRILKARESELIEEKVCTGCGVLKPLADYRPTSDGSRGGCSARCKGCEAKYQAEWWIANGERGRAVARAYYERNRALVRERDRRWREANRQHVSELTRERNARRRARILGAKVEDVLDYEALWNGKCGICEMELTRDLIWPHPQSPSVDHIIPLARGGAHSMENLQWAHLRCNISKGARGPEEHTA